MTKVRVNSSISGCNVVVQKNNSNQGHVIIQNTPWYPSIGLFPQTGSTTSTIYTGYQFKALDDGFVNGISISKGQIATAWTNSPGQDPLNWDLK